MGEVFSSIEWCSAPLTVLFLYIYPSSFSLSMQVLPAGSDSHAPASPGLLASLLSPAGPGQGSGHISPGLSSSPSGSQSLRGSFQGVHYLGQLCRCETCLVWRTLVSF